MGATAWKMMGEDNVASVRRVSWLVKRRERAVTNENYAMAAVWDQLITRCLAIYLRDFDCGQ